MPGHYNESEYRAAERWESTLFLNLKPSYVTRYVRLFPQSEDQQDQGPK